MDGWIESRFDMLKKSAVEKILIDALHWESKANRLDEPCLGGFFRPFHCVFVTQTATRSGLGG